MQLFRVIGRPDLRETLAALGLRGFGAVALLLATLLVTRNLSPEDAGIFFLGLSMLMVLVPIGLMGLPTSLTRLMSAASKARSINDLSGLNRLAVGWVGFGLGGLLVILYLLRSSIAFEIFAKPALAEVLAFMLPASLLFAFNVLRAQQLIALRRELAGLVILFLAMPVLFAIGIWLSNPHHPAAMARVYFFSALILHIAVAAVWRRESSSWGKGFFPASTLWQVAWPLWVVAIAGIGSRWGGQFISGIWLTGEEIALIVTAERLGMLAAFANVAIGPSYSARFARAYAEHNHAALSVAAWQGVLVSLTIAVPVVVAAFFFPSLLLSVFGEQYGAGAAFLRIFCLGYFVHALFGLAPAILAMNGYEREVRTIALVGSTLTISGLFMLVPTHGAISAVWVMAGAVMFISLVSAVVVYWRLGLNLISPSGISGVLKRLLKRTFARDKASGQSAGVAE